MGLTQMDLFNYHHMITSACYFYLLVSTFNLVHCSLQKQQRNYLFNLNKLLVFSNIFYMV